MAREWGEGLNKGLLNFINAYQQQKQITDANEFRNQQMQQGLLAQQAQAERQAAQDAFDREKFDYAKQQDQAQMAFKEKELKQKGLMQRRGLIDEFGNPVPKKRPLPAGEIQNLADAKTALDSLKNVSETFKANPDMFGKTQGLWNRATAAVGMNDAAATLQSQLNSTRQVVGIFLEKGVLRKEDEEKYKKMLPEDTDTPEVAANKIDIVHRLLNNKLAAHLDANKRGGYDVSGFEGYLGQSPENPLTKNAKPPSGDMKIKQAAPMSKPKSVTQNGQTYILNEQTGEYE